LRAGIDSTNDSNRATFESPLSALRNIDIFCQKQKDFTWIRRSDTMKGQAS